MNDWSWDHVRVFNAVMKHRSLSQAAVALGMSQPTASRHLRAFEAAVGAPLFVRHAQGMRPTDRATQVSELALSIQNDMTQLQRVITEVQDVRGVVRIAAAEIVGVEALIPKSAAVLDEHPGLRLEFVLDNTSTDPLRGESDIAVRMFRPQSPDLVARYVGSVQTGFFAAAAYCERHGRPATFAAAFDHRIIGFDPRGPVAAGLRQFDERLTAERIALGTDSLSAQLAAARAAGGIAILQRPVASRYPELVELEFPDKTAPTLPIWLVTPAELRRAPRITAVMDWLEMTLRAFIEG